jgi:hypothetical protein
MFDLLTVPLDSDYDINNTIILALLKYVRKKNIRYYSVCTAISNIAAGSAKHSRAIIEQLELQLECMRSSMPFVMAMQQTYALLQCNVLNTILGIISCCYDTLPPSVLQLSLDGINNLVIGYRRHQWRLRLIIMV